MEEPDENERIPSLYDLEPEAKRTLGYLVLSFWIIGLIVFLVFAFMYQPWDGVITLGTIAGIVFVAVILHQLQTVQFSLKTVLIAILTLQIPMGLLLTSKASLQTSLGIVVLLIWLSGVVTYVLVTAKPANK